MYGGATRLIAHGRLTSTGVHRVRVPDQSLRHQGRIYSLLQSMTYEESFLDCADEYGCVSLANAKQLFIEHGSDYWEAHKDGMDLTLNADKLLAWLGY